MKTPAALQSTLEREIFSCLVSVPNSLGRGRGDGEWTTEIKRGIGTIGQQNGYLVCATGFPDPKNKEWLYDLVWFRNNSDHHLLEVALVLESEWHRDPDEI